MFGVGFLFLPLHEVSMLYLQASLNPIRSVGGRHDLQVSCVAQEPHAYLSPKKQAMTNVLIEVLARKQRVKEVLLACLQAMVFPLWPGADGLTIDEVLRSYPQAMKAGLVPGQEELLRSHPDLSEELLAFLAEQGPGRV
jgi:hypothetical protein